MIEVFFKEKGFVILELNGESAHNHILYEADSSLSPRDTCQRSQNQDPQVCREGTWDTLLKEYYWKPLLWSENYFVTTVSENSLDTVRTYIKTNRKAYS